MLIKLKNEIIDNKIYFYFSMLITFFTILPQLIMTSSVRHFIIILLLFMLLFLTSKFSKILFSLFVLYINIVNIIQSNIYLHWGEDVSLESRFQVAVRSPLYESLEYLNTYVDYRDIIIIFYSFFILLILYRFIKYFNHSLVIIKGVSIVGSIILFSILISREPLNLVSEYIKVKNSFSSNNTLMKSRNNYLASYYKKNKNIKNNQKGFYNKIIIIQGESVNKHFLNTYGYDKKTSPFITQLINNKNTFKFNAISPSNQTSYAIPMIFTRANVLHWKNNFIHSESILSNFNEYRYKTYWISNQGKIGKRDDWISNIAYESNETKFFNHGDYSEAKSDDVIVQYLNKRKLSKEKEFYVFHLIGSHFQYTKRYTKEHLLNKNPKNKIEEYENTLYFTDYVIKNIFNYFKQSENVLIIYLSDHGELMDEDKSGHGYLPTYKDEYDIPLIIYSSIQNNRIQELYNLNKKHFFNTENMNYIIKFISGISDENNISYASNIFSVNPTNQRDYKHIDYYKQ